MLNPECFVAVVGVLARKLEPAPLRTVIATLAPLVGSAPAAAVAKRRVRRRVRPKASDANGSHLSSGKAGIGPGERCHAVLRANPDLARNASKLAEKVGCSRATAALAVRKFRGEVVPRVSRPGERARALLQKQLANGPRSGEEIEAAAEAAEIPSRSLVAAATALKITTQNGVWRLPG